jgi:hypothetical protein
MVDSDVVMAIRSNSHGISVSDAQRLALRGAVIESNQGNGIQVFRAGAASITDSIFRQNSGDGVRIWDTSAAQVVNNLVESNGSSGILVSGDAAGSPDALIVSNTVYANTNRGIFIGGGDFSPPSPHAVVARNILKGNGTAGIQVNILSRFDYEGDFNLSVDQYNAPVGPHDLLVDPLFVDPEGGDFHLSQTAAGQRQSSQAVDAGDVSASAVGMNTKTTRTDSIVDRGMVDLGYHYAP